ncbi:MAG: endonuclease/exonuclease/phosphatase family protein [Planctomycetota bacterium]|nr:endonuclease/exonuclease/phosphatase family protein [Planctomycetota bacterium]
MTWNILHGGGGVRVPEIILELIEHNADIVVLTEFRPAAGGRIRAALADHGYEFQATAPVPPPSLATSSHANRASTACNRVLIASKRPARVFVPRVASPASDIPPPCPVPSRFLAVEVDLPGDQRVIVLGVHIPDDGRPRERAEFWQYLVAMARALAQEPVAIIGDFNAGRHRLDEHASTFSLPQMLGQLWSLGYDDAFRLIHGQRREFTWLAPAGSLPALRTRSQLDGGQHASTRGSEGAGQIEPPPASGFRIDTAWLSSLMAKRLTSAAYFHGVRERRLSDHSLFRVEFRLFA